MMKSIQVACLTILVSGCTCSIMLTDSHGTDNDVDSTPTQETQVQTELTAPKVPIVLP